MAELEKIRCPECEGCAIDQWALYRDGALLIAICKDCDKEITLSDMLTTEVAHTEVEQEEDEDQAIFRKLEAGMANPYDEEDLCDDMDTAYDDCPVCGLLCQPWEEDNEACDGSGYHDLRRLSLGTRFFVENGHWYGRICGTNEDRQIFVEATGETYPVTPSAHLIIRVVTQS